MVDELNVNQRALAITHSSLYKKSRGNATFNILCSVGKLKQFTKSLIIHIFKKGKEKKDCFCIFEQNMCISPNTSLYSSLLNFVSNINHINSNFETPIDDRR